MVDPCAPDAVKVTSHHGESIDFGSEPRSIRFFLGAERAAGAHVAHMVVRGTYLPNTVRCIAKNTQRAPSYTGLNDWTIDTGLGFITCYADVRANAYILGSGPPTLTVVIEELHYWMHADQDVIEELRSSAERVFVEGGYHDRVDVPAGGIAGREEIMFIGPAFDVSVEAWQIFQTWDVQQREDDTVIAVHPARDYFGEQDRQLRDVSLTAGNGVTRLHPSGNRRQSSPGRRLWRTRWGRPYLSHAGYKCQPHCTSTTST